MAGPFRKPRSASGFTLVEAVVGITLAAIAGSSLMLGVFSSVRTTSDVMRQTIAMGLAQQLMDEIVGLPYETDENTGRPLTVAQVNQVPTVLPTTLGPETSKQSNGRRTKFADTGDYSGYVSTPPDDPWGIPIGQDDGQGGRRNKALQVQSGFFDRWRQQVAVYYVDETGKPSCYVNAGGTTTSKPTEYRAVEVSILYLDPVRGAQTLAFIRQIVTYAPYVSPN